MAHPLFDEQRAVFLQQMGSRPSPFQPSPLAQPYRYDEMKMIEDYHRATAVRRTKVTKSVLILLNLLFWLVGAAMLGFGLYMRLEPHFTQVMHYIGVADVFLTENLVFIGAYMLIAAGGFITIVGFFGCCGALRENVCLLKTYFSCLMIVFLSSGAVGILVLVQYDRLWRIVEDSLWTLFHRYNDPDAEAAFGFIQSVLHCCGVNGPNDWGGRPQKPSTCSDYQVGCLQALSDFIEEDYIAIAALGFSAVAVQVIGMVLSCVLVRFIRRGR